jgi:hypothetical protein
VNAFVALDIQHAMRMRHIVTCGLPGSTTIFHNISQKPKLKKKKNTAHKMCLLIFSTS